MNCSRRVPDLYVAAEYVRREHEYKRTMKDTSVHSAAPILLVLNDAKSPDSPDSTVDGLSGQKRVPIAGNWQG